MYSSNSFPSWQLFPFFGYTRFENDPLSVDGTLNHTYPPHSAPFLSTQNCCSCCLVAFETQSLLSKILPFRDVSLGLYNFVHVCWNACRLWAFQFQKNFLGDSLKPRTGEDGGSIPSTACGCIPPFTHQNYLNPMDVGLWLLESSCIKTKGQ